jgi:hypothetical protein
MRGALAVIVKDSVIVHQLTNEINICEQKNKNHKKTIWSRLLSNQNKSMNILITILSIIAGIISLLLIIALFTKKGYKTYCEIIINAPRQKAFDYLKQIKNQDSFNKWIMVDPDEKRIQGN